MKDVETLADMASKSAPPVSVSAATLFGMQLSDVVLYATLAWIVWQFSCSIYDRYKRSKKGG